MLILMFFFITIISNLGYDLTQNQTLNIRLKIKNRYLNIYL